LVCRRSLRTSRLAFRVVPDRQRASLPRPAPGARRVLAALPGEPAVLVPRSEVVPTVLEEPLGVAARLHVLRERGEGLAIRDEPPHRAFLVVQVQPEALVARATVNVPVGAHRLPPGIRDRSTRKFATPETASRIANAAAPNLTESHAPPIHAAHPS